jgi:hypothetical protein
MLWAIDVSSWDARKSEGGKIVYVPVNWKASGLALAIIKCSEAMVEDPAFKVQWAAAKGMPRMAYHFFRSNVNAIAQAWFVKSILNDFDPATDHVALDFETADGISGGERLAAAGSWLYEMGKIHITPFIYTYSSFWLEAGGARATWAKQYPLWFAAWPKDNWIASLPLPPRIFDAEKLAALKAEVESGALKPHVPLPWQGLPAIWQFTARADTRAVNGHPGIKVVCDYNAVYFPLAGSPGLETVLRERACPYPACPIDGK